MAKVVKIQDLSKEIAEFSKASLDQQLKAVQGGLLRSVPDLVEASPVDTGLYAQSWDVDVNTERGIIGNFAPYAPIIEFGARRYKPPLKPLLEWAKRVLKDPSQPPNYSPAVQGLARYTQKKIEAEGFLPKHVLTKMLPKILENIRAELVGRGGESGQ